MVRGRCLDGEGQVLNVLNVIFLGGEGGDFLCMAMNYLYR